jgi:hypothetical protein
MRMMSSHAGPETDLVANWLASSDRLCLPGVQ